MVRDVPVLSVGHPRDTIGAILAAVGDGSPDNTFALTERLERLSLPELHLVSQRLARAARDVTPLLVFESAMAQVAREQLAAATPPVAG